MKILQFINGIHPGGKERRLMELLKYITTHNSAHVELALMSREMKYPEFLDLGITTHYLIRRGKKDPRVLIELYRLCKQLRPDIIHTWDSMTAVYATPVARLLGIKLVNGMITDAPAEVPALRSTWIRSKFTFALSDAIVGNSLAGLEAYRAPVEKSYCVYNGFSAQRTAHLEDPIAIRSRFQIATPRVVGMVGEFAERKDFETFIMAAQQILRNRRDVTFITVGDGKREQKCKAMVEPQFRDRIKFLGWQSDVESIVNIMDIGVLATFTEGISNSILEYMALAKPVVATDGGGTKEIIVDNSTGFLVPERNAHQLAERIVGLLDDPVRAEEMGARGLERVRRKFDIETMATRYLSLYHSTLRPKPRILFFINGLHPGGKERRLVELLKYIKERDAAVVELALMSREMRYPEFLDLGIKIHYLIRRTRRDLRVFKGLFQLCRSFKPDIVHTWDSMTAMYAVPVVQTLDIKLVNGMITDAPLHLPPLHPRTRITFPYSDVIVANSRAGLKAYKAPLWKSVCVYNGFNPKRIEHLPPAQEIRRKFCITTDHVVGMIGEFAERKDWETYLYAAACVLEERKDVTFLTVGDGEDEFRCKGLVPPHLKDHIKFLGWQSHVEAIINIMDVGIMMTNAEIHGEGISNSILEYMALGKPVIANDTGGTREIVTDGVTGFIVGHRNVGELAQRLVQLLDDPALMWSMGEKGRVRVAEEFSIERMGAQYLGLYRQLGRRTRDVAVEKKKEVKVTDNQVTAGHV